MQVSHLENGSNKRLDGEDGNGGESRTDLWCLPKQEKEHSKRMLYSKWNIAEHIYSFGRHTPKENDLSRVMHDRRKVTT
jgi:hypothetical protein